MTVSSTSSFVIYAGDGVATFHAVPFEFILADDLGVYTYPDSDTDDRTKLVLGTDYTVTGGVGSNGSITLVTPVPVASSLLIQSERTYGQRASYTKHGTFPAQAHEDALDDLAIQVKQIGDRIGNDPVVALLATVHWDNITNKPTTFAPGAHTHLEADITDLDKYTQAQVDSAVATRVEIGSDNEVAGVKIAVVATLPGTPDADTIYFVTS